MPFRIVVIPRVGKAARREERTRKAIAAGRKTFSQLRAERWMNATQEELAERYAFRNPGTRKSGMIGVESRR